ncbi:carboxylesterase/lipase family protein [Streptomyces sp. NPDC021212]|uniref:carboxylesterase/lipase family protein n=1 Tax=Streptomyces sp. NPDC021212 TaxID=3365118 RepID=UPI0037AD2736
MIRRVLAAVVTLAALITVPSAAPTVSRPLTVATDKGLVKGAAAHGVGRFLGIPYAAPPVGDRRWQPPAPAAGWSGVRSAGHPGATCVQTATGRGPGTSEDCLYLNVYAPERRTDRPLPVLFWIHGGGFMSGSGDLYDGSTLARTNNIVVVTINYRLGVFGFLDLPGLSERGAGNYGLLDQQAALRWTQRNIAAFGGDPGRVTVSGESAGGQSVCALLASPPARGLFDRAIIQSGGCPSLTPAQSTARGRSYATAAGCRNPTTGVSCLRAKRPEELLAAGRDFGGILNGPLPVSGVPELPVAPGVAVRSGRFADVPLLIGTNRDEIRTWALPFAHATENQYERVIRQQFGPHAGGVLARYPYGAHGGPYDAAYALGAVWTDSSVFYGMGGCQYQRLAGRFASVQPRTYFYEFGDRNPPAHGPTQPGFTAGAAHAAELPYLWPSMAPKPLTPEQQRLSRTMMRYWGAFVRDANPTTPKQAAWPPYRSGKLMSLLPGDRGGAVDSEAYSARHRCSFWNGIGYDWLTTDPMYLAKQAGVPAR